MLKINVSILRQFVGFIAFLVEPRLSLNGHSWHLTQSVSLLSTAFPLATSQLSDGPFLGENLVSKSPHQMEETGEHIQRRSGRIDEIQKQSARPWFSQTRTDSTTQSLDRTWTYHWQIVSVLLSVSEAIVLSLQFDIPSVPRFFQPPSIIQKSWSISSQSASSAQNQLWRRWRSWRT